MTATAAPAASHPFDPTAELVIQSQGRDWFQPQGLPLAFKRPQNNREVNLLRHPELGWTAAAPPLQEALFLCAEFLASEGLHIAIVTELGRDRVIQQGHYRAPKRTAIERAIATGKRDDPLLEQYRRTYANLRGKVPQHLLEAETLKVLADRLAWEEFTWHFVQRHTEEEAWQSWGADLRTVENVGTTQRLLYTDDQVGALAAYVKRRMPAAGFEHHTIEKNAPHLHCQVRDPRGRGKLILEQAIQACY